jgi:hypothetical protein
MRSAVCTSVPKVQAEFVLGRGDFVVVLVAPCRPISSMVEHFAAHVLQLSTGGDREVAALGAGRWPRLPPSYSVPVLVGSSMSSSLKPVL